MLCWFQHYIVLYYRNKAQNVWFVLLKENRSTMWKLALHLTFHLCSEISGWASWTRAAALHVCLDGDVPDRQCWYPLQQHVGPTRSHTFSHTHTHRIWCRCIIHVLSSLQSMSHFTVNSASPCIISNYETILALKWRVRIWTPRP